MSDLLNKNWSTGTPITMAEILDAREHRAWDSTGTAFRPYS